MPIQSLSNQEPGIFVFQHDGDRLGIVWVAILYRQNDDVSNGFFYKSDKTGHFLTL
jgi:hypothetical protein